MAGPVERAVRRDLRALPPELNKGAIAASVLLLARELDSGEMSARDAGQVAREIRLAIVQMRELAPPGEKGDTVDELRLRRERRLTAG